MPVPSLSTAALLHRPTWCHPEAQVPIADGVTVGRAERSSVDELYRRLCSAGLLQFDPEQGSPFGFGIFVRFDTPAAERDGDFGDPFARVERICNLITVFLGEPVFMTRVIRSENDFQTAWDTQIIHNYGAQSEFLIGENACLDNQVVSDLRTAWELAESCWARKVARGRIVNALAFFYYAWRADYLEQICLNLAVCLELLFAPHAVGETTHQIAFNVAHFLGDQPEERAAIYRDVKSFYGARSSIIHGGLPDQIKIVQPTIRGFRLCVEVFRKILRSRELVAVFDDEQARRTMLNDALFGT